MSPLRNHQSYLASIGHRLSGIALAVFLPLHFWLLGSAMQGAKGLDRFLVYTDLPPVLLAEWGLVTLLALHLFFGMRILLLEFSRRPKHAKNLAAWVVPGTVVALLVGVVFSLQVI